MNTETKLTPEQEKAVKRAHAHGFANVLSVLGRPKKDAKGNIEKSASGDVVRVDVTPKEASQLAVKGAKYLEKFHGYIAQVRATVKAA